MPPDQSHPHHAPVKARDPTDSECLQLARPSLSRRETASAKLIVYPLRPEHPLRKPRAARLVRAVGCPDPLSPRTAIAPTCNPSSGRGASNQSLQPTSCHEYPRSHATSRLPAFTFCPPQPSRASFWVGAQLSARAILGDAGLPSLALQPWIGHAVGAAPAGCYRILIPEGARGVPRTSPSGPSQPASSPTTRLADAPCRYPRTMPGIPCPAARARTHFRASQPKDALLRARGAFHQQVPPSTLELSPERRPHGPPPVPWLRRRRSGFQHAFTLQPEER